MNERAVAYMLRYGKLLPLNGHEELMLPLDRVQGFLDLLTPGDVPPENIQKLYRWQAEAVPALRTQLEPWKSQPATPSEQKNATDDLTAS